MQLFEFGMLHRNDLHDLLVFRIDIFEDTFDGLDIGRVIGDKNSVGLFHRHQFGGLGDKVAHLGGNDVDILPFDLDGLRDHRVAACYMA